MAQIVRTVNIPTEAEKAALAGTSGTAVGAANKLVDSADTRLPVAVTIGQIHQVYVIGDSLSSDTYEDTLTALLGALWNVNNKGVAGNTTTQMLARFAGDVVVPDAEYVIVFGGINDVLAGTAAATIESNLQAMYTAAAANGSTVIAVTITPFGGHASWSQPKQDVLDAVNAWIAATATDIDHVINAYAALEDPQVPDALLPAYATADKLHLTSSGYVALAGAIHTGTTWTADPSTLALSLSGINVALSQSLRTTDSPQFSGLIINGLASKINLATPIVGLGTISPQRILDVRAADLVLGSNDQYAGNVLIMANDAMGIDKGGSIGLGGLYGTSTYWTFGSVKGAKENATAGNAAGYLSFWTPNSTANTFERMRISSVGYVGINTTAPASWLDINPAVSLTAAGTTGITARNHLVTLASGVDPTTYATVYGAYFGTLQLYSTTANQTVTQAAALAVGYPWKSTNTTVTSGAAILVVSRNVSTVAASYGVLVNASTGATANYAGAFLGGNVGIGNAAPAYTLDITGNLRCSTGFGCNGTTPQTAYASGGAVATGAGTYGFASDAERANLTALVANIRAALVANGIMS